MLNAQQKRALAVLDGLLASQAEEPEASAQETQGKKGKKKAVVRFLPSCSLALPWLYRQEQWAPDWCEGWYFRPDYAHAQALGVTLETRARIAGIYVDEHMKPIQDVDKDGKLLFTKGRTTSKGKIIEPKPVYKKLIKYHLEWAQSSAFCFRENYTIHMAANDTWERQQKNNPFALRILKAKAATPRTKEKPRDPGEVLFALCPREDGYRPGRQVTMTQDAFVRYLITGEGL